MGSTIIEDGHSVGEERRTLESHECKQIGAIVHFNELERSCEIAMLFDFKRLAG